VGCGFCILSDAGIQNRTNERENMSLREVLIDELRDLYSAENQLVKALPKTAKGADSPELKQIFTQHLEVARQEADRQALQGDGGRNR
jgi:hypothetical protein